MLSVDSQCTSAVYYSNLLDCSIFKFIYYSHHMSVHNMLHLSHELLNVLH